jgi:hypothetical protein
MQPHCLVKLSHDVGRDPAQEQADAFNAHRADLLGLGLCVMAQPGALGGKKSLKREDAGDVTGTIVTMPRPKRSAVAFARSLLTITAGRRLLASAPSTGSRSVRRISPRRIREPVCQGGFPRLRVPR